MAITRTSWDVGVLRCQKNSSNNILAELQLSITKRVPLDPWRNQKGYFCDKFWARLLDDSLSAISWVEISQFYESPRKLEETGDEVLAAHLLAPTCPQLESSAVSKPSRKIDPSRDLPPSQRRLNCTTPLSLKSPTTKLLLCFSCSDTAASLAPTPASTAIMFFSSSKKSKHPHFYLSGGQMEWYINSERQDQDLSKGENVGPKI